MAEWKQQVLQFWDKIDKRQRYTIIGVAVLALVSILGWSYWWSGKPDLVPLYTGLEAKDAGEVTAKLKEMKVQYEPRETPDGTAIFVQSKDVHNVRLDLANIGLPRGKKGFEIFENSKLGTTEFQNSVNYLQALQGELARTIEKIDGVKEVRVHIVMPEDSLYKKNEKPATASVMLLLEPDVQLAKPQIKGIVNLVAHSIKGLQAENITILDQQGRILNDPEEEDEEKQDVGKKTLTQLDMTRKVQERLQKNVQTLLDQALGEGKAFVRLSVELDFDQRMTDRQLFAPVVDDSGIIRSSQETTESYSGTNTQPGGAAGTASNIPGYVAANNSGESQYDKKEVTRNYEINETKEKIVASPGAIKRLTIAVLVDNNDEQLGQAQRESISRAVSSAVGLDANRGDTISVEPLPFSTELAERRAQAVEEQKTQAQLQQWLAIGAVVLVLLGILLFFYLRRRKQLQQQREKEAQEQQALLEALAMQRGAAQTAATAGEEEGSKLSPEEEKRITEREAIEEMIRTKPEEVTQLLRTWLSDE